MITQKDLLANPLLMSLLHSYFAKIKFNSAENSLEIATITKLCAKHRQHLAYSTLRTNFGMTTIFTFDALLNDLLTDSSGRCYQHNASVYLALLYLGFSVDLIQANMPDPNNPSAPSAIVNHIAIILTLNDQRYLVDPGCYTPFSVLELPLDHLAPPDLTKEQDGHRVITNPDDLQSFLVQRQVKQSWLTVCFFSSDSIELSDLAITLPYITSDQNPNYHRILIGMFQADNNFCLYDKVIFFNKSLGRAYIEQPSIDYALKTFAGVNAEFAEVSCKAQTMLARNKLVNDELADWVRHKPPAIASTEYAFTFNVSPANTPTFTCMEHFGSVANSLIANKIL